VLPDLYFTNQLRSTHLPKEQRKSRKPTTLTGEKKLTKPNEIADNAWLEAVIEHKLVE
jgi:hypothetical protein